MKQYWTTQSLQNFAAFLATAFAGVAVFLALEFIILSAEPLVASFKAALPTFSTGFISHH